LRYRHIELPVELRVGKHVCPMALLTCLKHENQ
jgi:hypothetical protein